MVQHNLKQNRLAQDPKLAQKWKTKFKSGNFI
jgi:hypothetical protein